jgi:hypothetical protein
MKQLLCTTVFFMLIIYGAFSQTDKGTVLLGGGATFTTSDGTSVFNVTPTVGLFILNDVVVGAGFDWYTTKGASSWAIGPFIRLYLFGNDRGKFIVQSGVNVGGAKDSDTDFGFDIGAGYAAFLNESIALEFLAQYTSTGDEKGIFSLGAAFQIHFHR